MRPRAILMGGAGGMYADLCRLVALEGWVVHTMDRERPLLPVSVWADVALVVVVSSGCPPMSAHLDVLVSIGYEGAIVVLGPRLTRRERQRAFAQGALDVIALPADSQEIQARLCAVLRTVRPRVSPPAP